MCRNILVSDIEGVQISVFCIKKKKKKKVLKNEFLVFLYCVGLIDNWKLLVKLRCKSVSTYRDEKT